MNSCILAGRLVKDPEIKDLGGNARMARYSLAVTREFRTENGDKTDYINCICFGTPAINAERFLHKGMMVCVRGWIRTGKYKNKEGQTVFTTDLNVERCEFLESKKSYEERMQLGEEGEKATVHSADIATVSAQREEPEKFAPTSDDDFMSIPDNYDEDNVPFA